jgi:hypothetical protein
MRETVVEKMRPNSLQPKTLTNQMTGPELKLAETMLRNIFLTIQ